MNNIEDDTPRSKNIEMKKRDIRDLSIDDLVDLRDLQGGNYSPSSKADRADITYVKKSSKGLIGSILFSLILIGLIIAGSWIFTGKIINISATNGGTIAADDTIQIGNYLITHQEQINKASDVKKGERYFKDGGFYSDEICDIRLVRDYRIYCEIGEPVTTLSWKINSPETTD